MQSRSSINQGVNRGQGDGLQKSSSIDTMIAEKYLYKQRYRKIYALNRAQDKTTSACPPIK